MIDTKFYLRLLTYLLMATSVSLCICVLH